MKRRDLELEIVKLKDQLSNLLAENYHLTYDYNNLAKKCNLLAQENRSLREQQTLKKQVSKTN